MYVACICLHAMAIPFLPEPLMKIRTLILASLFSATAWAGGTPGEFDSYLLSLSWSPDYCAVRKNDTEQCGKQLGFVLHGLWPQYNKGYPSDCSDEKLNPEMKQKHAGLFPSNKLFKHEWEKHGTCSGLSQEAFMKLSQQVKDKVSIPPAYQQPDTPFRTTPEALKADFAKANRWLKAESVAPFCSGRGRFLQEVRVCLDKQGGKAVACTPQVIKSAEKSCGQGDFLVQSVR